MVTLVNGCHGNPCGVLVVSLFVQVDHWSATVGLGWVESVQLLFVSPQLFYRARTESITRCDHHTKVVLDQPIAHLEEYSNNSQTTSGCISDM